MSLIKSDDRIYDAITEVLEVADQPLTVHQLMDFPDLRNIAIDRYGPDVQITINKLSDTLGFMWRRGVIDRSVAPPSKSQVRWAYSKKGKFSDIEVPVPKKDRLGKHALSITEKDGEVVLDFQQFTIVIRPKI